MDEEEDEAVTVEDEAVDEAEDEEGFPTVVEDEAEDEVDSPTEVEGEDVVEELLEGELRLFSLLDARSFALLRTKLTRNCILLNSGARTGGIVPGSGTKVTFD